MDFRASTRMPFPQPRPYHCLVLWFVSTSRLRGDPPLDEVRRRESRCNQACTLRPDPRLADAVSQGNVTRDTEVLKSRSCRRGQDAQGVEATFSRATDDLRLSLSTVGESALREGTLESQGEVRGRRSNLVP